MRVLVTGGSSLLGFELIKSISNYGHHCVTTQFATPLPKDLGVEVIAANLEAPGDVDRVFKAHEFDAVVNPAALAIPEKCEKDPARSRRLNTQLPEQLAKLCAANSVRLIHYSTDMVFDGKAGDYEETDDTNPTSLYGKDKLAGEIAVKDSGADAVILRLPLLMGNSLTGNRSVHEALLQLWNQNKIAPLFVDEFRRPTSISNLSKLTVELLELSQIKGVFHWCGATLINRWEIGLAIADHFKVSHDLIQKMRAADVPAFKDRPLNLTFSTPKLASLVKTKPVTWEDQLKELKAP